MVSNLVALFFLSLYIHQSAFMGFSINNGSSGCSLWIQRKWTSFEWSTSFIAYHHRVEYEQQLLVSLIFQFSFLYRNEIKRSTETKWIQIIDSKYFHRLMKGSGYIFGFLIPSSILLFIGLYMAFTAKKIAKISAGMQIDSRVRNKLEKRRGLQINLFIRVSY